MDLFDFTVQRTVDLVQAADHYRDLCLIQKVMLEEYGHATRDTVPSWSTLHRWLEFSFDAVNDARHEIVRAAQGGEWIVTVPTAKGAYPVPIY